MNRVYKTKWSAAHQQYVVTDEHHATKGKAAKSAVALAVAALMMAAGAQAAYMDPGFVATSADEVKAAQKSWETSEYQKDWGLAAMNASKAYALGFHGQNTMVGIMDSGALLQKHSELAGDRFHATHVTGQYGSTGNRYPQSVSSTNKGQPYEKGEKFDVTGNWMAGVNDNHGTHVVGTVGANRDGSEFHGVAWGSDILSGNTGATDNNNYGPYQDHDFFHAGWKAMADTLVAANGAERGGVINNSWGTNIRTKEVYKWSAEKEDWVWDHYVTPDEDTSKYATGDVPKKPADGQCYMQTGHLAANTVQESEYEYFYFKKVYGDKFAAGEANSDKSFVDAAWEAVKGTNVVQIFTTGNRNMKNPFYRPLYPYFNPEAEQNWIAVAGLRKADKFDPANPKYALVDGFNEAGLGKWWTVAAPGNGIYSTIVGKDPSITESNDPLKPAYGQPGYGSKSGTSMSAPHVAGAMGVLMSRYQDMNAKQVRDVMFTTANHYNADGSVMEGWDNVDNSRPTDGQVSDRMGWGVPDLDKGMYGPGQFLGEFKYNMANTSLDVWTNKITNVALDQRMDEEAEWLKNYQTNLDADDLVLGDKFIVLNGTDDKKDHIIDEEDAKKWRKEYFELRKAEIEKKQANDFAGYKGSLVKEGVGTLVMTGANEYKGATTVNGGTLLAFAESIGTDNAVKVGEKGTFGVLSSYDDQFTMKGKLESKATDADLLTINLEKGGTLYIDAASTVKVQKVNFTETNNVKVGIAGADREGLLDVYGGKKEAFTGTFESVDGGLGKVQADKLSSDSLFFELGKDAKVEDKKISVSMKKKDGVTMASFADTENQKQIANAIEGSLNDLTIDVLSSTSEDEITSLYSTLDDDFYATARNALVMNATAVSRTVMDQARGMGEGRSAEVDNGRARLWASGISHWGEAEGNRDTMDVDFRAGFLGAEAIVLDNTKFGAFFGYGTTDFKSGLNKIDGDDKHFGLYGLTDIGHVTMTYGVAYTDQDRDTTRVWGGRINQHSENASVLQGFVEGAYNFDLSVAKVSPYVGFTWARVETDAVVDYAIGHSFKTDEIKDDLQIATLGVRTAVPFAMGSMPVALTADLGWSHFFGDTEGLVNVQMGEGGKFAAIEGSELKDQANLGLGIVGQVAKHATVGVSYSGSWGSDINTHGIFANVRFNF